MQRLVGHLVILLMLVAHFILLFFACAHWHNWWSLFVWLPLLVAVCWPGLTHNYDAEPIDLIDVNCSRDTFQSCRELSWSVCVVLGLCAYLPPVLAWYNEGFAVAGVMCVYAAVTALHWAYVIWLRIYVFSQNNGGFE